MVNMRGFLGKRGVRQGDLLSHYLFVIFIEVLVQFLNQAAVGGVIKYHHLCAQISLTHIYFADDFLMFSEASSLSLQGIKSVMDWFYHV